MSQGSVYPGQPGISSETQRLLRLLDEALTLVDALALPPEIGARLQEVIDTTRAHINPNAAS